MFSYAKCIINMRYFDSLIKSEFYAKTGFIFIVAERSGTFEILRRAEEIVAPIFRDFGECWRISPPGDFIFLLGLFGRISPCIVMLENNIFSIYQNLTPLGKCYQIIGNKRGQWSIFKILITPTVSSGFRILVWYCDWFQIVL